MRDTLNISAKSALAGVWLIVPAVCGADAALAVQCFAALGFCTLALCSRYPPLVVAGLCLHFCITLFLCGMGARHTDTPEPLYCFICLEAVAVLGVKFTEYEYK